MTLKNLYSALLLIITLSACTFGVPLGERPLTAESVDETSIPKTTKSKYGNPSSYVALGERYYVLDSAEGFVQRGIASWYGAKFHGKKTSSGEVYNMHGLTAAHKTLPIPVYVRVENLENGKSLIVKVNDRGPFVEGRIIDLSYAAAKKLGVDGPGTARVEIEVLSNGTNQRRAVVRPIPLSDDAAQDIPLFIQLGSFGSESNARNMLVELHSLNETSATVSELEADAGLFYRVRIGPLYDLEEAQAVIQRIRKKGYTRSRIVVED